MVRNTLLDFFEDFSARDDVFIVHDDGYRVRQLTYRELAVAARAFAARLGAAGVGAGDKVVIWSENRAEWVIALWGCLLTQAVVVPVDFRASGDLVARISAIVQAKVVLVGDEITLPPGLTGRVWHLGHEHASTSGPQGPGTVEPQNPRTPEPVPSPAPSTLAEIIFTSGATAEPKGVTITHKNILANTLPIEREIAKYRHYVWPFHPLRFLNLLPLSHMFGQSMATFIPPMLAGTVIFSHGYSPTEILRQIKSRRVSVLVCVPKVLDVLREHLERVAPMSAEDDPLIGKHWAWRWWHYRAIHRLFGWKFWCVICGAAPLDPGLEAFWRKLGFLVVQGYGLTETAPVVTLNHPFHASRGSVGKPIAGVDVKIAPDGEILVRGDNVTQGYYDAAGAGGTDVAAASHEAFRDGWFHTGDIGELDAEGRLLIKGRKKEMIVTPQGLNVFPEDVERALTAQAGVTDAGVVARRINGEERIHAVLVLEPGADIDAIVRGANARLEDHQRVWSTSIWPADALPRTEGTSKLKRRELQRWVDGESHDAPARATGAASIEEVIGRYTAGRTVRKDMTLDDLGLSSLDRVELMMALEEVFQTTLDESELAGGRTVGEIDKVLRSQGTEVRGFADQGPEGEGSEVRGFKVRGSAGAGSGVRTSDVKRAAETSIAFPAWNRTALAWFVRRISLPTWILPLAHPFIRLRVEGREHLDGLQGPVIFASNHQSHMDTPVIMIALPRRFRYRLAPAMAKEFFKAHFNPDQYSRKEWFTNSLNYYLSCEFFNAFPLPQREAGTRQTLRYIGEILGSGYSVLIFPEGKRSHDGEILRFMAGIGMIGARLDVPVVPVRIEGLNKVLHPKMKWPKRGPVRVAFGQPQRLSGEDYDALARQVEDAVRTI